QQRQHFHQARAALGAEHQSRRRTARDLLVDPGSVPQAQGWPARRGLSDRMRIAYVTPYQGPTLLRRRPIVRNRSMSNRIKIELIATLLQSHGHDVELISQGEVVEHRCTFYPAFSEPELFHPRIPIDYASALPIRRLNGLWSSLRTLQLLTARHRVA